MLLQNANEDVPSSRKDKNINSDKGRSIVYMVLLANALLVIGATYGFLANQEKKDFDSSVSTASIVSIGAMLSLFLLLTVFL